jgi:GntR family transcriptional regulator
MTSLSAISSAWRESHFAHERSPTPLYMQLQHDLRRLIEHGGLRVGEALPSERDLASGLGISRVTVRKAIQGLVKQGLLTRRHGAGNFIASPVEQPLSRLTSFSEDMRARGMKPTVAWLERSRGLATPREAMALNLSPGTEVSRLHRLRRADERPVAIELATIPRRFLDDPNTVESSLYATLAQSGIRPQRALQHIRAEVLAEGLAELLQVPSGSAALYIERQSFLSDGRPVEFTRSHYRGDSYDFVAELHIEQGSTLGEA